MLKAEDLVVALRPFPKFTPREMLLWRFTDIPLGSVAKFESVRAVAIKSVPGSVQRTVPGLKADSGVQ